MKIMITQDNIGGRIDKFIASKFDDYSREYIKKILKDGNVKVNGSIAKPNYKLKLNDELDIVIPEPEELEVVAEDIPLDIMYEDDDIVIVNKKQGMVVHPAPGNYTGTMVNALLYKCKDNLSQINGVIRPGIVHRIDKDTSGILVVAKNNNAHVKLSELFKEHNIKRKYHAIVHGNVKEDSGKIDLPIGRHSGDRKKMTVTNKNSRNAVTRYRVLERFGDYTYIECTLETGRTHQIRVHMTHKRHPLLGDPVYGPKNSKFKLNGQLLHAKVLGFVHPTTNEYIEFESDLPEHFEKVLKNLRNLS